MEIFSDDLLIYILSFTYKSDSINLMLTCKRFYELAYGKLKNNRIGWLNVKVDLELMVYLNNKQYFYSLKRFLTDLRCKERLRFKIAKDACLFGNVDIIEFLLNENFDLSFDDNYCIEWASFLGKKDVIKLLLKDPRVDPSVNCNAPIKWVNQKIKRDYLIDKDKYLEIKRLLLTDHRVKDLDI